MEASHHHIQPPTLLSLVPLPPPLYIADPLRSPPQDGTTPFHIAASHGWLDLIDKLLAEGADINATTDEVPTHAPSLLQGVARACGVALGLYRATISSLHHQQLSPSHARTCTPACRLPRRRHPRHTLPFLQLLIASGAQGHTPLHLAVESDQSTAVERLVEKGADIEAKVKMRGQPPLHRQLSS
jgi:ankyrin repeat protein